jgi:CRP-like cAMP-binding protein
MDEIKNVIRQLIKVSDNEIENFLLQTTCHVFKRNEILSSPGKVPNEIFFLKKGLVRVLVTDKQGIEHTIHFALENQFIADYSNFILHQPSQYSLQAVEETEVVILSRKTIEWGYLNLREGEKMGRKIAEYYFIYQDDRIKNLYLRTPKERYDTITAIFPNIHNRVPQHMIASYLGITPIHLSRLKNIKE